MFLIEIVFLWFIMKCFLKAGFFKKFTGHFFFCRTVLAHQSSKMISQMLSLRSQIVHHSFVKGRIMNHLTLFKHYVRHPMVLLTYFLLKIENLLFVRLSVTYLLLFKILKFPIHLLNLLLLLFQSLVDINAHIDDAQSSGGKSIFTLVNVLVH